MITLNEPIVIIPLAEYESLKENEKDAARYRFLRSDKSAGDIDICVYRVNWKTRGPEDSEMICGKEVDDLADELMALGTKL